MKNIKDIIIIVLACTTVLCAATVLILALSMQGCQADEVGEEKAQVESLAKENTAVIYYSPNGAVFSLDKKSIPFSGDAKDLLAEIIDHGELSAECALNSFKKVGKTGWVDMNLAYGKAASLSTHQEWMYTAVLVNTFLDTYGLDRLLITIDGETYNEGHAQFDEIKGYYDNN